MGKDNTILDRRFIPAGTVFIREGEEAYSAFIIQSGKVSVYSEKNGIVIEFAQLGAGEICGEMALISDVPRTANVKTIEDSNLIAFTEMDFNERLNKSDRIMQSIMRLLIERVKESNSKTLYKKSDPNSIADAAQFIYSNLANDFSKQKAAEFERIVKPKLNDLITAIEGFAS